MIEHNELTFRLVERSELKQLRNVAHKTFTEAFASANTPSDMEIYVAKAFNIEQVRAELEHPLSEFYFVKYRDQVIGYLKLNERSAQTEETLQEAIEIERIYVLSDYQGMKIGQYLMNQAIDLARQKQKETIWLGVWEENKEAIRFYQRHGFISFAHHNFMLGHDEQTDILMKRTVNF